MSILMSFLDSGLDDRIEADDQAGDLDRYMMQKRVLDTVVDIVRAECDHPDDSVEVINAIYNDGNETTEPECTGRAIKRDVSSST